MPIGSTRRHTGIKHLVPDPDEGYRDPGEPNGDGYSPHCLAHHLDSTPGIDVGGCYVSPPVINQFLKGFNMATVALTKDNFDEMIKDNETVIVDFWAEWCGPCRTFAPTFEAASEEYDDIVFGKVDTEDQQELAQAFNIRSIPTLMVFRDQVILYAQPGALPGNMLEDLIGQVKEIDMDEVHAQIAEQDASEQPVEETA